VGMGKVAVVGQGYVGLPLAMQAVEAGFEVVGYDVDSSKVQQLTAGQSYVEDVPNQRLAAALGTARYKPTAEVSDLADFDYGVISVPTPLNDGIPDLTHIEEAARTLGQCLHKGATVVLESTTYPGTTEELVGPLLEGTSGLLAGRDFYLGYSPERIDPGNPKWHFGNTPKVVSGIDDTSLAMVRRLFDRLVETTVPVRTPMVAELTKLLENTFRHVNIALANELAMFAADLGIDVWEAIDAASTKPFGFMRFTPGPGVGGHCLPIDPSYLSWRVRRSLGQPFRFVELANDINDHMPDYVVRRIVVALNRQAKAVNGSRVLLLGLSYKKNTGDARESPSHAVVRQLRDLGADLRASDPHVLELHVPPGVQRVDPTADELAAADAVVLLVDHDAFDLSEIVSHAHYVLDCRYALPEASHVERL
jgi:UDP-N-acetyl-D-glucosamine dehydrogenase